MKVLLIGSGGREHTLAWKLKQSPRLSKLYCAPGNPGTAELGENVNVAASDINGLLAFSQNEGIDLTVVGPEAPLVKGIVDRFEQAGLLVAGPSNSAAALEGSKTFAKDFMKRHNIPTAAYKIFTELEAAKATLKSGEFQFPLVVKADGLAAGKGVFICNDLSEGLHALQLIMEERKFGSAGNKLVIEEFLEGEEVSFMVFTDGEKIIPMVPSQDHKAIFDGDRGPNTGGMGAYSVDWLLSEDMKQQVLSKIIQPTILGMASEGNPFRGVLYAGLKLSPDGPKVLEFNVRFGDPETQALLPRMKGDLVEVFSSIASGDISKCSVGWHSDAVVCIVLASSGYPGEYPKGAAITGLDTAHSDSNVVVFQAGTTESYNQLITNGGRVLGVTARAASLEEAISRAYQAAEKINFKGKYLRTDIGAKGLAKLR